MAVDAYPPMIRAMDLRTDMQAVLAMQPEVFRLNFPGLPFGESHLREYEQMLTEAQGSEDHRLLVAEMPGEGVVGFLWVALICEDRPQVVRVNNVCVAPRARRRGIGRALMAEAEAFARERGAGRVILQVSARNEPAVRLYELLGYAVQRCYTEGGEMRYQMARDLGYGRGQT